MDIKNLTTRFDEGPNHDRAFVLLHGMKEGLDSQFMRSIFNRISAKDETVLSYNFPYFERDPEPTRDLGEEIESLQTATSFLRETGYKHVSIIAKSLGGVVASRWLRQHPENPDTSVNILGYAIKGVDTPALKDHLNLVIQGRHDRFGSGAAVQSELDRFGVAGKVIEIANADHSYCNQAGKAIYHRQVINLLTQNCL